MKLTTSFRPLVAIALLHLSSTHGAEVSCDCTEFPFSPNPPCVDVCIPKHMAIAPVDDLKNVFGLPKQIADTLGNITPIERPRSLETYDYLILGYKIAQNPEFITKPKAAYQEFEMKVHSLRGEDFQQVRAHAEKSGWTLDKLKW